MARTNTDPRRAVRFLVWSMLGLLALVVALGGWAWNDAGNKRNDLRAISQQATAISRQATVLAARARREAAQTHLALCALRSDLDRRAAAGEKELRRSQAFLASHPDGIPGISASLIREEIAAQKKQVAEQRSTISALSRFLTCR